ncbi:sensor histidine kinase [Flindersiella endophytica]
MVNLGAGSPSPGPSAASSRATQVLGAYRYLTVCFLTGGLASVTLPLLGFATFSILFAGLGFFLVPAILLALRRCSWWEHKRSARYLGQTAERQPLPTGDGILERLIATIRDPVTWRTVGWALWHQTTGPLFAGIVLFPVFGAPLIVIGIWGAYSNGTVVILGTLVIAGTIAVAVAAAPFLARIHAVVAHALLSPSAAQRAVALARRVDVLAETRADALEAHGAELRRIERDLHDGAQARLVSLTMRLGLAERAIKEENPEAAAELLREARDGAEEAMTELRDVVRTIYPPILADRGLSGAVSALGARCAVPARITAGELGKVPASVEAAAYFFVAEALTNVAKHSQATEAVVWMTRLGRWLHVQVLDDGAGGVDETNGTGIDGIRRRVAALDGRITIISPPGGPTSITIELPCGS